MVKRLFLAGMAVTIGLSVVLAGCAKTKPSTVEVKRPEIRGVTVETVAKSTVDDYYETSGTIKAKYVSVLASKVMGGVTGIFVKQGERVKQGQLLLTIDDLDARQRLAAADAGYREALFAVDGARHNYDLAEVTYDRYKRLYEKSAISRQDLDRIETQKKVAAADLQRAQQAADRAAASLGEMTTTYNFTKITSPADGVVTERKIDVGSMAVAGTPLITVDDDSAYMIEASVDEKLLAKLVLDTTVEVAVDSLGRTLTGQVTEIVPTVDPATRTFLVKVDLGRKQEGVRTGLYAKVRIPLGNREGFLLPAAAVVEKGQLSGVYVVGVDGVTAYRLVKVGKAYGSKTEILTGLTAGDKVIIAGLERAVDGGLVKDVAGQ